MTAKLPPMPEPDATVGLNSAWFRTRLEAYALQAVRDALERCADQFRHSGYLQFTRRQAADRVEALLKEYSDE